MKLSSKISLLIGLSVLVLPFDTFAALTNPLGNITTIQGLIGRLIKVLLGLAGSLSLLMFVWGGFQYLWSAGDDKKVQKGKDTLKNAVLGIVIIFFAYAAVNALITALSKGTVT